jgi:DNA-binding NarL/FixJ family response regulator
MTVHIPAGSVSIAVMLVDDHRVVRTGVSAYLDLIDDILVIGEAADGRQALDQLAGLEPRDELPEVVLMDMVMPIMDGVTATRQIKARWPVVEVVAMTSFVEEAMVRDALEAGAAGYLLKDADADEVAHAIRAAVAGQMHLDPVVARLLADSVRSPRTPGQSLTLREREVLALIADGASNRQIASSLVVSERTARTHVSAILSKLELVSRTQAALWAVREGFGPTANGVTGTRSTTTP